MCMLFCAMYNVYLHFIILLLEMGPVDPKQWITSQQTNHLRPVHTSYTSISYYGGSNREKVITDLVRRSDSSSSDHPQAVTCQERHRL